MRGKAAIAWLMALMVLSLGVLAGSATLHRSIHPDADAAQHQCAVTMFAHGQVDAATVDVAPVVPAVSIETTPSFVRSIFSPTIENLPAGRAPPVSVSSPV